MYLFHIRTIHPIYFSNIVNLCLRIEILDSVENGVATAFLYNFESKDAGEHGRVTVDLDISWLKEGTYKTMYTLFVLDTDGESIDLDCVNGLDFEKRIVTERKIVWHAKAWGSIELPELSIVDADNTMRD